MRRHSTDLDGLVSGITGLVQDFDGLANGGYGELSAGRFPLSPGTTCPSWATSVPGGSPTGRGPAASRAGTTRSTCPPSRSAAGTTSSARARSTTSLPCAGRARNADHGPVDPHQLAALCQPRLQRATRACGDSSLPAPQVVSMRYSRASALAAVAEWTQGTTPVTAVAAFNDLIALAVLASCRTQHIEVPDDLALIGVDDLPVSSLAVPAVTTIGMDLTPAAGNLTTGIHSTVGAPAPAEPSRSAAGDILALIQRETTWPPLLRPGGGIHRADGPVSARFSRRGRASGATRREAATAVPTDHGSLYAKRRRPCSSMRKTTRERGQRVHDPPRCCPGHRQTVRPREGAHRRPTRTPSQAHARRSHGHHLRTRPENSRDKGTALLRELTEGCPEGESELARLSGEFAQLLHADCAPVLICWVSLRSSSTW
ncbi:substrate-binding domain-containing protein [Streptomyces violaceus]|uniref:Substrate-binding domain-containing protein n=1 Tax=Streptomyces violaceus TaxID=1936 RepID=A0ABZ1P6U3_STRVL